MPTRNMTDGGPSSSCLERRLGTCSSVRIATAWRGLLSNRIHQLCRATILDRRPIVFWLRTSEEPVAGNSKSGAGEHDEEISGGKWHECDASGAN
jgi:hypothetical protein